MPYLADIDLVIIFVRADPFDPHDSLLEVYRRHQPVIVPWTVKHQTSD
jgi:hypothetical protein